LKEKPCQEAVVAGFKVLYRRMPEGLGENDRIPEVGIAVAWAEI
jgi:hypothetical protein